MPPLWLPQKRAGDGAGDVKALLRLLLLLEHTEQSILSREGRVELRKYSRSTVLQSPSRSLGRRSLAPNVMGSWDWKKKNPETLAQPGSREGGYQSRVFARCTKPTALVFPVSSV